MQVAPEPPLLMADRVEQCRFHRFALRRIPDHAEKHRLSARRRLAKRQFGWKRRAVLAKTDVRHSRAHWALLAGSQILIATRHGSLTKLRRNQLLERHPHHFIPFVAE